MFGDTESGQCGWACGCEGGRVEDQVEVEEVEGDE